LRRLGLLSDEFGGYERCDGDGEGTDEGFHAHQLTSNTRASRKSAASRAGICRESRRSCVNLYSQLLLHEMGTGSSSCTTAGRRIW
jgi:hypothetical protein